MRPPFFPTACTVMAVVLAALVAPRPASAAAPAAVVRTTGAAPSGYDDPRYASSTTVEVQGTVTVAEVEDLGRTPSSDTVYAVTTDDGAVVPVTVTRDLPANGEFSGELVVRGELARSLADEGLLPSSGGTIDGDSAAAQTAVATAEEQGTPLPVAEATVAEPAATAQTATPSAHRAYVVKMVDQGSVDGTPTEVAAAVDDMLAYWTTESEGAITSFARQGDILDLDSAGDVPASSGCGIKTPFALWQDAAGRFPGVNFNLPGNHLIVLVGDECGHSGPVGVATVGTGLASGGPSVLTFDPLTFAATGAHELGHNFGLQHANLDTCPSPSVCEYYDFYSPMALSVSSPPVWAPTALGTLYRAELGLTTTTEVTSVASPQSALTQTYELAPRGSSSGLRGLLVTDPTSGTTYSVDYRNRTGRDSAAFYDNPQGYVFGDPVPDYPTGVVVERQSGTDATYLMTREVDGRQTGSFAAGSTFSPSPRLSVSVGSTGSSASVTVSIAPDVPSAEPTVSGTVAVGQSVAAVTGTWSPGTTFTYDWRLGGTSTGVTGQGFAVPDAAAGQALTVAVTGSKPGFTSVTRTSAASTVAYGTLASSVPTLSASPRVGQTVSAVTGSWSPGTAFTYAWSVDGVPSGVTSSSFDVPAGAAGEPLTVTVTGTKAGYASMSRTSSSALVAPGTLTPGTPAVSGTPKVGATLTAAVGTWTPAPTHTYAWLVGSTTVGTAPTLVVPASALGKTVQLRVTGTRTGYFPATVSVMSGTVVAGTLRSATPLVSGTAKVGRVLKVARGTWTTGTSLTQQWYANGAKVTRKGTGTSFTLTSAERGKTMTVKVTGRKTGYTTVVKTSARTRTVAR